MVEHSSASFLKAAALKLGSALLFAAMAVQVRFLGASVPVGQAIFFRALFAIIPIVIVFAMRGELAKSWHTQRFSAHVFRGAISIASSFCYYGALARLPIVDTTAISFVTPLITVALAAIFLRLGRSRSNATRRADRRRILRRYRPHHHDDQLSLRACIIPCGRLIIHR